jgi:hypothetical protein
LLGANLYTSSDLPLTRWTLETMRPSADARHWKQNTTLCDFGNCRRLQPRLCYPLSPYIQATHISSHAQRGKIFSIIISHFDRIVQGNSINISNAGLAAALNMAGMAPAVVFWASWDVARHLQLVNSSRTCNLTHSGTLLTLSDCPTWAQAASYTRVTTWSARSARSAYKRICLHIYNPLDSTQLVLSLWLSHPLLSDLTHGIKSVYSRRRLNRPCSSSGAAATSLVDVRT